MLWLAAVLLFNDAVLKDAAVTGYMERLCQRLAPKVAVTVVVDTEARADAVPGEGIRITAAMIAGAQNEAEVAGILAHEIAHYREGRVCLRFSAQVSNQAPKMDNAKQWEHDADQAAIAMLTK